MSFWLARGRKEYICDKCGKPIKEGKQRIMETVLAIEDCKIVADKNYHLKCAPEGSYVKMPRM